MSEATKLIVDGYLSLKDRASLEALREHRQRLTQQLRLQMGKSSFDPTKSIQLFDGDLEVIEVAIAKLNH
jgi:hypothetical protein